MHGGSLNEPRSYNWDKFKEYIKQNELSEATANRTTGRTIEPRGADVRLVPVPWPAIAALRRLLLSELSELSEREEGSNLGTDATTGALKNRSSAEDTEMLGSATYESDKTVCTSACLSTFLARRVMNKESGHGYEQCTGYYVILQFALPIDELHSCYHKLAHAI